MFCSNYSDHLKSFWKEKIFSLLLSLPKLPECLITILYRLFVILCYMLQMICISLMFIIMLILHGCHTIDPAAELNSSLCQTCQNHDLFDGVFERMFLLAASYGYSAHVVETYTNIYLLNCFS